MTTCPLEDIRVVVSVGMKHLLSYW
jgi:hypothetical protein